MARSRTIQKVVEEIAPPPIPPLALKVEEAAEALRMSPCTMRRLIADGAIRVVRVGRGEGAGRSIVVPVAELQDYLQRSLVAA